MSSTEAGAITLSNAKRFFRSRFCLELSETALWYGRMTELLQDPRFGDICRLESRGGVQFVVRQEPHTAAAPAIEGDGQATLTWAEASSRTDVLRGGLTSRSGLDLAGAKLPSTPCHDGEPLSAGATMLAAYIRQLLELRLAERRVALRALSEHQAFALSDLERRPRRVPDPPGSEVAWPGSVAACAMSRCSSAATSCSTHEGSAWHSDDDLGGAPAQHRLGGSAAGLRPPPGLGAF